MKSSLRTHHRIFSVLWTKQELQYKLLWKDFCEKNCVIEKQLDIVGFGEAAQSKNL